MDLISTLGECEITCKLFLVQMCFESRQPINAASSTSHQIIHLTFLRAKMAMNLYPQAPEWDRFDHEGCEDVGILREEYDKLRRLMFSTTRAYNRVKEELDRGREALGICKMPFPILRLPREIRDQIYLYALQAQEIVSPDPCPSNCLTVEESNHRPPTPGLCFVNKQIYVETVPVLYSKNTFYFERAGQLLDFEKVIGPTNCQLIQHIQIYVEILPSPEDDSTIDPDLVISYDWQGFPSHWAKGLRKSSLRNVIEISVIAQIDRPLLDRKLVTLPSSLRLAIHDVFCQRQAVLPRMNLSGFDCIDFKDYHGKWKVSTKQFLDQKYTLKAWILEPRVSLLYREAAEESDEQQRKDDNNEERARNSRG